MNVIEPTVSDSMFYYRKCEYCAHEGDDSMCKECSLLSDGYHTLHNFKPYDYLISYNVSNQSYIRIDSFKVDHDVYEWVSKLIKELRFKLLVVALRSGSGYVYSVSSNGSVLAARDSYTFSPKDIFIELLKSVK